MVECKRLKTSRYLSLCPYFPVRVLVRHSVRGAGVGEGEDRRSRVLRHGGRVQRRGGRVLRRGGHGRAALVAKPGATACVYRPPRDVRLHARALALLAAVVPHGGRDQEEVASSNRLRSAMELNANSPSRNKRGSVRGHVRALLLQPEAIASAPTKHIVQADIFLRLFCEFMHLSNHNFMIHDVLAFALEFSCSRPPHRDAH